MAVGGSVVTALAVATGVYLFSGDDTRAVQSSSQSTSTAASDTTASVSDAGSSASSNTASAMTGEYEDGTYSTTISYTVPHGYSNGLTAKVTVENSKVTAVNVEHDYTDRESGMFIDSFESELQSAVVGQDIGDLSLARIGGATLTTQAFDDAITDIRNDAKV